MHPILGSFCLSGASSRHTRRISIGFFHRTAARGKVPRAASSCGKDYLTPAAVTAGVIKADESVGFGRHDLRHSLATFFGSQEIPVPVIQKMLQHEKSETTLHYVHGVNKQHMDAQKLYLDAIGIGIGLDDRSSG
jgi:integrase